MESCQIHYDVFDKEGDSVIKLTELTFKRLKEAQKCRVELGGDNLHVQGSRLPDSFDESFYYHKKCYKKFTMAISIHRKRTKFQEFTKRRTKLTGELSQTLFPKHCMICKKIVIVVNRKKQVPILIELEKAEKVIKEAAKLSNDESMLTAIHGYKSLRAAEF